MSKFFTCRQDVGGDRKLATLVFNTDLITALIDELHGMYGLVQVGNVEHCVNFEDFCALRDMLAPPATERLDPSERPTAKEVAEAARRFTG